MGSSWKRRPYYKALETTLLIYTHCRSSSSFKTADVIATLADPLPKTIIASINTDDKNIRYDANAEKTGDVKAD